MTQQDDVLLRDETSDALARLTQSAAENAYLLRSDFYTMRDWLEIAGTQDDEALTVVLLLMFAALEDGSLCIEVSERSLSARLKDLVSETDAQMWTQRVLEMLGRAELPSLFGTGPRDHKPIIRYRAGDRLHLYFQKHLRAELDFARHLRSRLDSTAAQTTIDWDAITTEVLERDPLRLGNRTLELDREQTLALRAALGRPLTIISGGPGTGKTSIVLTLLRCLVRGGVPAERIALAAPTGRAAQRLTDSLRTGLARLTSTDDAALATLGATTLHQLLSYRPARNLFARHRENPIPADVVIIDEVSMVGLVLMAQLLDALDLHTRLILLGDRDQLPSVEAGAVLAHLVDDETPRDHVVLLRTNHRSEPKIREAAQAINARNTEIIDRLPRVTALDGLDALTGCWLLEQTQQTAHEIRAIVQKWADQAIMQSRLDGATLADLVREFSSDQLVDDPARARLLFALLDRFRLLTLVRDGAWGCVEINHTIEEYLRPRLDPRTRGTLFAGAPVLITRNDAARGLFNGDVGITLRNRRGGLDVVFARQSGCIAFPAEALPAHELGFALTVHKSQGSEYANVMVVLPPAGARRLLTKELVYTAITRAKSLAVICSPRDVLELAIGRRIVRESGVF